MTTWKELIQDALRETGERFEQLTSTLTSNQWYDEFDAGHGRPEGIPFTAWGPKYVYFPVVWDGKEWVGYAPRWVSDRPTQHQGG